MWYRDDVLPWLREALDSRDADFRPGQWEAIDAVVNRGGRHLLVQRTGWGKSIVYFLATRCLREDGLGPTLLVSPLLALMRNQLVQAARAGLRCETINSTNSDAWGPVLQDFVEDRVDILLISPERLANERFREEALLPTARGIGMLVVDEAHCISDWGHDFRPDYQRIVRVLQLLPQHARALATTATANNRVVDDISSQLGVGLEVHRGELVRRSLQLQTLTLPSRVARMAWLAQRLEELEGTGIVYTLTVRDAVQVAHWLQSRGFEAEAYHGRADDPEHLEEKLLKNEVKCLVATSALGMGFDKRDVRFVIHYQRPGSVIRYYQEVGRAGRAVDSALGILLSGQEDKDITDYFIKNAFPPEELVTAILRALESTAFDGLSKRSLEKQVNARPGRIELALKWMAVRSPAPIVKRGSLWCRAPVQFSIPTSEIERLTNARHEEQRRMDDYLRHEGCLMEFMQRELDDPLAGRCGRCARCQGHALVSESFDEDVAHAAARFLTRRHLLIKPRKLWPGSALADLGFTRALAHPTLEGRALSQWGEPVWGAHVRDGKHAGHLSDRLVSAVAAMLTQTWRPDPSPQWVTSVPSLRDPNLVLSAARRLAELLDLPFHDLVKKAKDTKPQKEMHNSPHQARNALMGFEVLEIPEDCEGKPCLLVDDVVDSGWTLAVIAELLAQAGSGPVLPVAFANTSSSRAGARDGT